MKVILNVLTNYRGINLKPGDFVNIDERTCTRWINKGIAHLEKYQDSEDTIQQIETIEGNEKVSIIIPVCGALEYLKRCIDSIVKYTLNYELIIIDNGSDKKTKEYIAKQQEKLGFILQTNKKNTGFSYACNQGIKLSTCDYLCFLNSDTVVTPNWLSKLMRGFSMPDAGIVGPSTCFCGGEQMIKRLISRRLEMSQKEINAVNPGTGIVETEIYGFCYTVSKKVINDIGVFDDKRYPIGGAEEKDFSWRAHKAGYKSYWVKDSYVHHFGNKTFIEMGIKPIEPRRKNDKAFEARKSDNNIYVRNTVRITKQPIPILMVVLDRYEYTKKAINALLENTNYPFKLFIFNNGSDGKTTRLLELINDSRVEIHHSTKNLGLVTAMNMFFDRYKDCKIVAKVDNDTIVYPDWLGKLKDVIDAFPLLTVQANHYLAMPFAIESNDDFYKHCFSAEFNGATVYFYRNSGGTGQLIRRDLIDGAIPDVKDSKGKGGLSGWCNVQVKNYKKYPSAFYSGVWIDRQDQIATNKYKPVSDYPHYDEMIKKMRPWGLGYAKMNISELSKLKSEMESWYKQNVGSVY